MNNLFQEVEIFVTEQLKQAEKGHDIWHIRRVVVNAKKIQTEEGGDPEIIILAAWLHDIADAKFHQGNEEIGPELARNFLENHGLKSEKIEEIVSIIKNISFRKTGESQESPSLELQIVRDADRLDAIGAIGIARAFHYGGYKNRLLYNPDIPLKPLSISEYKNKSEERSTLHHFFDKLFKIKDLLHTKTAKEMAEKRHHFMEKYVEQFLSEWNL